MIFVNIISCELVHNSTIVGLLKIIRIKKIMRKTCVFFKLKASEKIQTMGTEELF